MNIAESSAPDDFEVRSLAVGVFIPHSIMAVGQGATAPMIALVAIELGASVATAGLIVGLFGLGAVLGDVPGGFLASRLGDRRLMLFATGLLSVAALGVLTRPSPVVFGVLVTLMGAATAMFALGRLAYATEMSPIHQRGRVMSAIGGTQRLGLFVGPILGSLSIVPLGITGPFLVHAILAVLSGLSVLLGPDPSAIDRAEGHPTLRRILREHRTTFATAAVAAVAIQIVRSSRQAVIPLWGSHLGLEASQIAFLFSLSAGMEILMFYPVGRLMDMKGRKKAAIPSLTLMSLGMAAVPLTFDALTLGIVAAIFGFASGMGAGINMTLSSDLAPTQGRSVFFGIWRMITDAGAAGGPSLVGLVVLFGGLNVAAVVIAGFGIGGALLMWLAVPETLRRNATPVADMRPEAFRKGDEPR